MNNYYCIYDGQGNVSQVSNKIGDLPYNLYTYDSYGLQTGSDYYDESYSSYKGYDKGPFGYKTGVRQYDPETGRFLSPDPFKGYMDDPSSQHPYMYCKGNPIRYSDPSGYSAGVMVMEVGKVTFISSPAAGPAAPVIAGAAVVVIGAGYTIHIYTTPEGRETLDIASKQAIVETANIGRSMSRFIHRFGRDKEEEEDGKKKKKKKKKVTKKSGKEKADDIPSWAPKNIKKKPGESGKDIAKRICDDEYGKEIIPQVLAQNLAKSKNFMIDTDMVDRR